MKISRRFLTQGALEGALVGLPGVGRAQQRVAASGNPVLPNIGACDPQIRIYDGQVYMYSTHDAG